MLNLEATALNRAPVIGCVGLGRLGLPMAVNLIAAGFPVFGYRRSGLEEFQRLGGRAADSVAALALECDVVITCLPSEEALETVVAGPDGLLQGARAGQVVIEASSFSLDAKNRQRQKLATLGVEMLDCPISGNARMMQNGEATVYASGNSELIERMRPVLEGFAKVCLNVGPFGSGSIMKYMTNMLVAVHCMAAAEIFNVGSKIGISPHKIEEIISLSAAANKQLSLRAPIAAGASSGQRATSSSAHNEMDHIADFLLQLGAPAPLFATARRYYQESLAAGHGGQDMILVYRDILRSTPHGSAR